MTEEKDKNIFRTVPNSLPMADDEDDEPCLVSIELHDNVHIELEESFDAHSDATTDQTGDCIWDCAMRLCAHLVQMRCQEGGKAGDAWNPQGKRILELGSGTGAVGIALTKLGASAVCLSDQHIELLQRNVERNCGSSNSAEQTDVRVVQLEWSSCAEDFYKASGMRASDFDWVVASDVVYPSSPASDLAHLLGTLLKANSALRMLLAYERRPVPNSSEDHARNFFECLAPENGLCLKRVVRKEELEAETISARQPTPSCRRVGYIPEIQLWRH